MIDARLLLCGLVAWGAVGVTVSMGGGTRTGTAVAVGLVLTGVGLVALLLLRSLPLWCGVLCLMTGAAVVSAALQVAAWTDPDVERVFRDDVIITAGVHGTVERVDTSDGPVWAPAARWRVLLGARGIQGSAGSVAVDLPVILETSDPGIAAALPPPARNRLSRLLDLTYRNL